MRRGPRLAMAKLSSRKRAARSAVRLSGFRQRQAAHYEALVSVALHALARMPDCADTEALHDLRVSLRSQRVLLTLFPRSSKVAEVRARLGAAATLTNQVRDLEVAQALAQSWLKETGAGQEVVAALADQLVAARSQLLEQLHLQHLDEVLEDAESAWLGALLNKRRPALQGRARRRARRLAKKLLAKAAELDRQPVLENWHQVRLAGKRLRYWSEGVAELLTHRQRRRLKALRDLQQSLGSLHDLELFEQRFGESLTMPAEWLQCFEAERERVRHEAASTLGALRACW